MPSSDSKHAEEPAVAEARDAVRALFPDQIITSSSPGYAVAQKSFWNAVQREKEPGCFFQPTSAEQVAKALVEVVRAQCPFAIKGGGHSSNAEGCSVQGGFQFDLCKLDHVTIAEDRKTVRVGPGMRWGDLFTFLERHGLTTVGGRDANVGVPGFIFGGGLSYHSTQYGWGIDNLVSADIVTANGDLLTVDRTSHSDLHRALRGGGAHNFGIVTSLTLKVFPYQGMWGGYHAVTEEHFDSLFKAYDNYTKNLVQEGTAHMIVDFYRQDGIMTAVHFMGYPKPINNPPIYDEIRRIPSVANTLRLASYRDLAEEMRVVTFTGDRRNAYWTFSMEYDIDLLKSVYSLWAQRTEPYAERFHFAFDVNHITPMMRNKSAREGIPNMYALEGADEPLTNILLTCTWEHKADDAQVRTILAELGAALEGVAAASGKSRTFKYMNYAHQQQDVIGGFGKTNKAFLKEVAAEYDPDGVFQKLQRSGFKLDRPAPKI
ncbi:hypothetical protein BDW66DRAFT_155678 [Aspergillus desertorum]